MRNISELNINDNGKPIGRSAPTSAIIEEFQTRFDVQLPESYIIMLRQANGGHPEVDSIELIDKPKGTRWAVNRFYHLDEDKVSSSSLWLAMERWRKILGANAIPFASDGGGNQFVLDLKTSPPCVKICVHDEEYKTIDIAPSFEAFIDALSIDPDMI